MSVFTSVPFTMTETDLTTDHPIIGWQNIVTTLNLSASSAQANYPISNAANRSTFLKWKAQTASSPIDSPPQIETIYIAVSSTDPIDYVAIAGHNFASGGVGAGGLTIGYEDIALSPADSPVDSPPNYITAVSGIPTDSSPLIFRFTPIQTRSIRIQLTAGTVPAELAVIYCGKLLVVQRQLYAGHVSTAHGRSWKAINGMSENGQFLGRIITTEFRKSKIPLSLLEPAWYRSYFNPFLAQADENPFFFSWRPNTYPAETAYAWLISEPTPAPTGPSNLIALDLDITGIG